MVEGHKKKDKLPQGARAESMEKLVLEIEGLWKVLRHLAYSPAGPPFTAQRVIEKQIRALADQFKVLESLEIASVALMEAKAHGF